MKDHNLSPKRYFPFYPTWLWSLLVLLLVASLLIGASASVTQAATLTDGMADLNYHIYSPGETPPGLTVGEWTQIVQQVRYNAQRVAGGYQVHNPAQHWTTTFADGRMITRPQEETWEWGLHLQGYGYPGHWHSLAVEPAITVIGNRLEYAWDDSLTEFYRNDEPGLKHGFVLSRRPGEAAGPLQILLQVQGTLTAQLPAGLNRPNEAMFVATNGVTVLHYRDLAVYDADGRQLPAWFELDQASLRLLIEDSQARYPLTVDPIVQQAYLKASNTGAGDYFGVAVAISGDTAIVGAYNEDSSATGVGGDQNNNSAADAGAAYVFVRSGGTWSQQAYLKASNTEAGDRFGAAVAISGDTAIVGALYEDGNGVDGQSDNSITDAGAAYVFVRSGGTWNQQAYLKASNTGADDRFGWSVGISGDTAVVGTPYEDSNATGVNGDGSNNLAGTSGAAYVFVRSGGTWSQQAYLKASNTEAGDYFGHSVGISGDTVIVGAYGEDSSATGIGGNQSNNSATDAGAAYMFVRNETTWSQQAYLKASNAEAGIDEPERFGYAVAISGDTAIVGADGEDSHAYGVNGYENLNDCTSAGAAYVFVRSETTWSQQAYLKAANTGLWNHFGYSVAISGDRAIVGTPYEDSNTTQINGDQMDNSAAAAGGAYLFVRNDTTWSQQAFIKASNTEAGDELGYSVAISGDTAIAGALYESSSTTGVNNNQSDNSAASAGAAFIFAANRSPSAVNDSGTGYSTDEDTDFTTGNVLTNDTDPELNDLSVIAMNTTSALGLVTYNGNGTFNYGPNAQFESLAVGQMATDVFTYSINDKFRVAAYWPLDEGSGTTAHDSSGNSYNGTLTNGPAFTTITPTAITFDNSSALSFDGVDDYVAVPMASFNNLPVGTIAAWVYLNSNDEETIFARQHDGGSYNTIGLLTVGYRYSITDTTGDAGRLYFHPCNYTTEAFHSCHSAAEASSIGLLNTGQWYHVALTFSRTRAQIYINGFLDNTVTGNFVIPNDLAAVSAFGAWLGDGGGRYLNGALDDVRFYDYILTAGEISTLSQGRPGFPSAQVSITVNGRNDPPTVAQPIPDQNAAESSLFDFSFNAGTFADVDQGDSLTYTAVLSDGSALPAWLSFTSTTRTFSGTPAEGDVGSINIRVMAADLASATISTTFALTVTDINNPPTLDAPAPVVINEDAVTQTVTLTGISSGSVNETETLTVTAASTNPGLIVLDGNGITYTSPDSTGSLKFAPVANQFGSTTVAITVTDGVSNLVRNLSVTVNPVNDAPGFTKGDDQTIDEDAGLQTVSGWAGGISAGPDESGQVMTFTTSNTNTNLFVTQPSVAANGVLTYQSANNANGSATVTVFLSDNGGTANDGVDISASQTFTITVLAVNDGPVNSVPGAQTISPNTSLIFTGSNRISVADVDAGSDEIQVSLTAFTGTVTLSGIDGLSFSSGDGTADAAMTFTGSITNVNTALDGLSFNPTADALGPAGFQIVTNDQGHTGSGSVQSDTDSVAITIEDKNYIFLPIIIRY